MPRFLTMIRIDEQTAPLQAPSPEFDGRMGALFEEITAAGVMLETAGLTPTSEGTRVTWSGGALSYTDGPFTETKEVVGGYAILRAKDKAEALEWTRRFLEVHDVHMTVTAEVRENRRGLIDDWSVGSPSLRPDTCLRKLSTGSLRVFPERHAEPAPPGR